MAPCRRPEDGPCLYCQPGSPKLCCDKHSPQLLSILSSVEPREFPKKPRRSKIAANSYAPGMTEEALTVALEEWRETAALDLFGRRHQDVHGGPAVLSDKVIQNIVKYASMGKITSVETLKRETHWSRTLKYGAQVLSIIEMYFPPAPPISMNDLGPPPLGNATGLVLNTGIDSVSAFYVVKLVA